MFFPALLLATVIDFLGAELFWPLSYRGMPILTLEDPALPPPRLPDGTELATEHGRLRIRSHDVMLVRERRRFFDLGNMQTSVGTVTWEHGAATLRVYMQTTYALWMALTMAWFVALSTPAIWMLPLFGIFIWMNVAASRARMRLILQEYTSVTGQPHT